MVLILSLSETGYSMRGGKNKMGLLFKAGYRFINGIDWIEAEPWHFVERL